MSIALNGTPQTQTPTACPITLTDRAASEVRRIIAEQTKPDAEPARVTAPDGTTTVEGKIHLRLRVVGGGCSGFQNKLDLDPIVNPKLDDTFELHGVPVVVDRRSLMYLQGVTVDFHDEINRRGFSVSNPGAKTTCGCGSSFSM